MTETYRWNQLSDAEAYDTGAPAIHPHYTTVQDQVLAALLPIAEREESFHVVDLGGGSGRLLQRLLQQHPHARATLIDQSGPFLDLARRRLAPYAERVDFITARLQDDWSEHGPNHWPAGGGSISAIVSTSAIHHLEPLEKQALFKKCAELLSPSGRFINGDEHRPAEDETYRQELTLWRDHMQQQLAAGLIPPTFAEALANWRQRNLVELDRPRKSGDDCHEPIDTQLRYLRDAGFSPPHITWQQSLWAVFVADK